MPEEILQSSQMVGIPKLKARNDQPDPFSTDELHKIAYAPRAAEVGAITDRGRAIVAVLLEVGLRESGAFAARSLEVEPVNTNRERGRVNACG